MVIQSYSSLFETPRIQLSREAFENSGIGIFSSEKIPFADRTGPAFAQNLVNLFSDRVKSLQNQGRSFPEGIHIYELGAGTGILAKRILDLVKTKHPNIYFQTILHVSDISKPMIDQLKLLNDFKKYSGHISFEIIDAIKPHFTYRPLLIYFTNLIDSLPYQRQILIKEGQIFEFQVQTSLKMDAQIIDATSYPPRILEEKEIAQLLSSPNLKRRLILTHQILPLLEEEGKFTSLDEITNMNPEERTDLTKLAASQNKTQPFVFNYSYPARTAIQRTIRGLDTGGFIFFSDFGITSREHKPVLYLQCGSVTYFAVDFPSFLQIAQVAGKKTYVTSNAPGHPQEMLIDTQPTDSQVTRHFRQVSLGNWQDQVNDFLKKIKAILSPGQETNAQKTREISQLYASLPREVKHNYQLLNDLAFFLLQAKFYNQADFYANLLFKHYGHATGVFYYLVKGKAAQEKGQPKVAEKFFKDAAEGKKGFFAWAYLGELYWKQQRYPEYIKAIKEYLKYTRAGNHLKSILSIALAQEKLFDRQAAQKTLQELVRIGRKLKTLSDLEKQSLEQARKLL